MSHERVMELQVRLQEMVFGQALVIRQLLIGLLAGGHVLLQGVPGVGKTRLARGLTGLVGGKYSRIQFTPDLMPSDILGNAVFHVASGEFQVRPGPIFANIVLADEINRTPPKTQAALLEAMEERQVSIYGETLTLPRPFFVVATQNPIEYEGTYPLPEAQLDRFLLQIQVDYPDVDAEVTILRHHRPAAEPQPTAPAPVLDCNALADAIEQAQSIEVSGDVLRYIVALVRATRSDARISLGASPRAATALLDAAKAAAFLHARQYVIPDDVLELVQPVLRHRLILSPSAELEGMLSDAIVESIVEKVEVPR